MPSLEPTVIGILKQTQELMELGYENILFYVNERKK